MEEVLLLGLKDKEGYTSFWNDCISSGLRGCILIELALRGRIELVMKWQIENGATTDSKDNLGKSWHASKIIAFTKNRCQKFWSLWRCFVGRGFEAHQRNFRQRSWNCTNLGWIFERGNLESTEVKISSEPNVSNPPLYWFYHYALLKLKNVRERLAKNLTEKGVLTTEKQNFLLFDMTTHPLTDSTVKQRLVKRVQVIGKW